jgi:hypothetical protein
MYISQKIKAGKCGEMRGRLKGLFFVKCGIFGIFLPLRILSVHSFKIEGFQKD